MPRLTLRLMTLPSTVWSVGSRLFLTVCTLYRQYQFSHSFFPIFSRFRLNPESTVLPYLRKPAYEQRRIELRPVKIGSHKKQDRI